MNALGVVSVTRGRYEKSPRSRSRGTTHARWRHRYVGLVAVLSACATVREPARESQAGGERKSPSQAIGPRPAPVAAKAPQPAYAVLTAGFSTKPAPSWRVSGRRVSLRTPGARLQGFDSGGELLVETTLTPSEAKAVRERGVRFGLGNAGWRLLGSRESTNASAAEPAMSDSDDPVVEERSLWLAPKWLETDGQQLSGQAFTQPNLFEWTSNEPAPTELERFAWSEARQAAPANPASLPLVPRGRASLGVLGELVWTADGGFRRLSPDGNPLWSLAVRATDRPHWSGEHLAVPTAEGTWVVGEDGTVVRQPSAWASAPFSGLAKFEQVSPERVDWMQVGPDASLWAVIGGAPSRLRAGYWRTLRGAPEYGDGDWDNSHIGLILRAGAAPLGVVMGDEPGSGLSISVMDTTRSPWHPLEGLALGGESMIVATSPQNGVGTAQTAWVGHDVMLWSAEPDGGVESERVVQGFRASGSGEGVLAASYHGGRLYLGGFGPTHEVAYWHGEEPQPAFVAMPNVGYGMIAELLPGDRRLHAPYLPPAPVTALYSTGTTLWAAGAGFVARMVHDQWQQMPSPLTQILQFWARADDDVWAAGKGGLAHWDGRGWRRVAGVPGDVKAIVGTPRGDLWIGAPAGLWRGTRGESPAGIDVRVAEPAVLPGPVKHEARRLVPESATSRQARAFAVPTLLGQRFRPHSMHWVGKRLLLSDGKRQVLWTPGKHGFQHVGQSTDFWQCTQCSAGSGNQLLRIEAGRLMSGVTSKPAALQVPRVRSLDERGGASWVVGDPTRDDVTGASLIPEPSSRVPPDQLLSRSAGQWTLHVGVPDAYYTDVAAVSPTEVWLAGAFGITPERFVDYGHGLIGEGALVHYRAGVVTHHRCPIGTLLAVATDGTGGAWAVGSAGQIIHATNDARSTPRTWQLAGTPWLRAVYAFGPADVWVSGDRSTLLHFDGAAWSRVDAAAIVGDQSITSLTHGPDGDVWALGERRVFQIPRGAVVEAGP